MAVVLVVYLALIGLMIASMWKIFEKAGQPGWAAIVPFYNSYVLTTGVAGKEPLWFFLMFVPFVGAIIALIVIFSVAEKFGKGGGYGIGLIFLPFIFFPMLAFGDAEHESQSRRGRRRLRSRSRDYDAYDDDDDRPAKKKRRARDEDEDDEDEEEERPSKRRAVVNVDDDDDDRPAKKRRVAEDDDENDRPARRRRRRDDDDD